MNEARSIAFDQRAEARAFGTLDLRYQRASERDVAAWVAGGPAVGAVRVPDPTMNFSPVGIAFDDVAGCADGDVLLLDLAVPGEPARWRGAARVVRVSPIPIDERDDHVDATHRVAVAVTALSAEGEAALRAYTARVRQANGRQGQGAR